MGVQRTRYKVKTNWKRQGEKKTDIEKREHATEKTNMNRGRH